MMTTCSARSRKTGPMAATSTSDGIKQNTNELILALWR
jgi:hypothetical protein